MNKWEGWHNRFRLGEHYRKLQQNPVAYFCMEFALPENLPIYSGGLGVLAGDYVSEALRQRFPMIAVGLFYQKKYCIGPFEDKTIINDPEKLGLSPVVDKFGKRIEIPVEIGDDTVWVQAWLYNNKTIPIYLLDTNVSKNTIIDREITELLYVPDRESRLKQEIVLGIGGVRFLEALGVKPSLYHMNEGHSAFLSFELSKLMAKENSTDFWEAFKKAKKRIVFTNHTLVKGGHDTFDPDLVKEYLKQFIADTKVKSFDLIQKGLEEEPEICFGTTPLAFESSCVANAVSKLHAEAAKELWPEVKMMSVTNGVDLTRWDSVGEGSELISAHAENKRRLLYHIAKETGVSWDEKTLVAGWARRIVTYKRPLAFFDELVKIKKLLNNKSQPLRLVFSGYPHYLDKEGRWLLNRIRELAKGELKNKVVYLEDYNIDLSKMLVAGCDVWLNTPIVGLEACGTSGMKAALNGALPCSTNDGWLPEVDLVDIGYKLDSDAITESLDYTFSKMIVNDYYKNKPLWEYKMHRSRQAIIDGFGADRMLADYIELMYAPIVV